MRARGLAILAGMAVLAIVAIADGNADEKPKYTIKEVMRQAHNRETGLLGKVSGGKASKEEKEKLLELYRALAANTPPRGEEQSWKEKTTSLIEAANAAVADDKDAGKKLTSAANCNGCHNEHRPKR